jgi:hypothetical protein
VTDRVPRCAIGFGSCARALCLVSCLCACSSSRDRGDGEAGSGAGGWGSGVAGAAGSATASSGSGAHAGGSGGAGLDAGRSGGGSGGGIGVGQAGASGGGAGTGSSGAGTGSAADGFCPGVELPAVLVGQRLCGSDAECSAMGPNLACMIALPVLCGGIAPQPECTQDVDCGAGRICVHGGCGNAACADGCTADSCGASQRCESGRCVPTVCDEPSGAECGADFSCEPASGNADPRGCVALSCQDGSYTCPVNSDCGADGADVHGCLHRRCTTAADCDCGSCIAGSCAPHPGACFTTLQPP